jgi:hypothetical protein
VCFYDDEEEEEEEKWAWTRFDFLISSEKRVAYGEFVL